ncbi:tRNA wybutosine-synthesizing protein 1 [Nannizzia gypsea CBS 118893]|uniref:tRNA 4-demethylwyosine synthase (AdoMet-dependent) n=1 Tax=Arthroderma gypseum (strain ATCC MYA-4604 / CBS 118893) TaxID=535722 RepID=E5R298_ARTGP|nr:tRNA wybutosine-synthesizing protein 1 [Nannizzia gypsea CBS 118893]EFQ96988.1 tRNA wybutosine-synthesizing protein 1 [Nannizzia gypsea CBS 118893]
MATIPLQAALLIWHTYRAHILAVLLLIFLVIVKLSSQCKRLESQSIAEKRNPQTTTVADVPTQPESKKLAKSIPLRSEAKYEPKRLRGSKAPKAPKGGANTTAEAISAIRPMFFFTSLTGSTEKSARAAFERVKSKLQAAPQNIQCKVLDPELLDLSYVDFDDYFVTAPKPPASEPGTSYLYCIILPSYDIDSIINNFLNHLDETHNDFRIDTSPLSGLTGYSVFGFGDKEGWPTMEEGFCSQAVTADKWLAKLTGKRRAYPLGLGDVNSDGGLALQEWCDGIVSVLNDICENGGGLGEGVPGSGDPLESDEEDAEEDYQSSRNLSRPRRLKAKGSQITDLEDIKFKPEDLLDDEPIDFTTYSITKRPPPSSKEMVPSTSPTYAALTKQGYTIVGSHSGVKICRWTKSALRGRGSCYKNSFYGIKSHLCMESTPSLSCSNKCIFCWRHGTNPVGTTWRWKVDPPELIFSGVKEGHYKKIKMLRGVPGVRAERFAEAMRIRHCALSLVGEPIFYPHINELLSLLHKEHISSFLVCNAQHPDELAALQRVTQLYVSIDASNRESLRKIDRPLHRDFWERLQRCLGIIREKRDVHRTVYRLTLVKGFNIEDEVEGYADLVEKGLPCFIEIKGVTYCGTSSSSNAGLTMQNVPFYHEIVAFVVALNEELARRGLSYGISAEHAHSCCVLLASNRFLVDGKWHTRINYERFFELLEREKRTGESFTPEDYMRETEEWALWGNGGFDPNDQRVHTKGKNKGKIGVPPPSGKVVLASTA